MTLQELVDRANNSGQDFDLLELTIRDPRPAAKAAESAGTPMMRVEADDITIVDGEIILSSYEFEDGA